MGMQEHLWSWGAGGTVSAPAAITGEEDASMGVAASGGGAPADAAGTVGAALAAADLN